MDTNADLTFSLLKSTVVEVKGRSVGIIGYVTRSTEYNFPLHEVIFNYKWYFTDILEM